jgi:hypothetical protein
MIKLSIKKNADASPYIGHVINCTQRLLFERIHFLDTSLEKSDHFLEAFQK